ncbi:MAG: hypothetical protein HN704_12395 [Bacteroidetes bacterium]|jgi:hypothetical protein|nr:hypothetical protein [Bacteroidota bacterium]MBT6688034.1 hypothetical protein [Bacteroidota bacterium]MBT7144802.1 hypothetical protein [Bacteroidota bacterium]MBT7492393.1 hypothetical protein [Bacteroidota bacterium]
MRYLVSILLIINGFFVLAQQQSHYVNTGRSTILVQSNPNIKSDESGIKYLDDEWKVGSLQTAENQIVSNVYFKYNVSSDKFEMRADLNPEKVGRIYCDKKVYFYSSFEEDDEIRSGYFELLSEGNVKLLLRYTVKRTPGRKGAFGYEASQNVIKKYYIKIGENPAIIAKRNKNEILNLLSDKNELLEEFIKINKLNLRKNMDIILLLNYYDIIREDKTN